MTTRFSALAVCRIIHPLPMSSKSHGSLSALKACIAKAQLCQRHKIQQHIFKMQLCPETQTVEATDDAVLVRVLCQTNEALLHHDPEVNLKTVVNRCCVSSSKAITSEDKHIKLSRLTSEYSQDIQQQMDMALTPSTHRDETDLEQ